jgi:hypothetical protein
MEALRAGICRLKEYSLSGVEAYGMVAGCIQMGSAWEWHVFHSSAMDGEL